MAIGSSGATKTACSATRSKARSWTGAGALAKTAARLGNTIVSAASASGAGIHPAEGSAFLAASGAASGPASAAVAVLTAIENAGDFARHGIFADNAVVTKLSTGSAGRPGMHCPPAGGTRTANAAAMENAGSRVDLANHAD
jgi:hypothetical protein